MEIFLNTSGTFRIYEQEKRLKLKGTVKKTIIKTIKGITT